MLPLIQREAVDRHRWLTEEELLDGVAVAQSLPGPFAPDLAMYIGYRVAGPLGLVVAGLGSILPSFLVTLLIVVFFFRFEYHPLVSRFFAAVRPAVLALIAVSAWELARAATKDRLSWVLALGTVLLVMGFHVHPAWLIVGGVAVGLVAFSGGAHRTPPRSFAKRNGGEGDGE